MNAHLEGVPQPYLGDENQPWLLTTYVRPGMILQVPPTPRMLARVKWKVLVGIPEPKKCNYPYWIGGRFNMTPSVRGEQDIPPYWLKRKDYMSLFFDNGGKKTPPITLLS